MDLITTPGFRALSLTLSILLTTYTTFLCGQPPNPTPYDSKQPDSLKIAVSPLALITRSLISITLGISHAILCLTYPTPPPLLCPLSSNLTPYLFTWTPYSIFCITTILIGCYIRLSSFSAPGTNFTFRLATPNKLVTSGLYNYVQHPSYTGKFLIIVGNLALTQRPDAFVGCWLPAWIVEARLFWGALAGLLMLGMMRVTCKRVREEEMLKGEFGREWEDWHERTKRFVPLLF